MCGSPIPSHSSGHRRLASHSSSNHQFNSSLSWASYPQPVRWIDIPSISSLIHQPINIVPIHAAWFVYCVERIPCQLVALRDVRFVLGPFQHKLAILVDVIPSTVKTDCHPVINAIPIHATLFAHVAEPIPCRHVVPHDVRVILDLFQHKVAGQRWTSPFDRVRTTSLAGNIGVLLETCHPVPQRDPHHVHPS